MSCHHDHHEHGGHDHDHNHDHSNDITPALQSSLYQQINFDAVNTLNEAEPRSGAAILRKTWAQRLDSEPELLSDVDEQLLIHVPFVSQTKLHSLLIRTSPDLTAPKTIKLFRNRADLDFGMASTLSPTQTIEIPQSSDVAEIPLNRAQWNATTSITIFVEDNWSNGDEDVTRISYLAFKGDFLKLIREPVSFLYEAAANPSDHKTIQGVSGVDSRTTSGK